MKYLSPKILEALEFASIAHKGQNRKFPVNVPYISHLLAVALILSKANFDEEVVIAGVLHDVLEDTPNNIDDIKSRFGEKAASLVRSVTEEKKLPWLERKEKYLTQLQNAGPEARAISGSDLLANRLSNLLGLRQGLNPWTQFSKTPVEYSQRIFSIDRRRLEIIKQDPGIPFLAELEEVMNEVEGLTAGLLNEYKNSNP
jgi:hypothetical protein